MEGLVTSSQAIETRLFSPPEIERLPMKVNGESEERGIDGTKREKDAYNGEPAHWLNDHIMNEV